MRIILHVGQSKTGTTALQNFLKRNRAELSKHKILYPDVYLKGMPINMLNHNPFSDALSEFYYHPRLTASEYWEQFLEQANQGGYHTILLSGESFFRGRPWIWELNNFDEYKEIYAGKLEKISEYLAGHEVEIVVYLRPQIKWLESAVAHIIRYEGTMKQKVYHSDEQLVKLLSPLMDYNLFIGMWDEILKPNKITMNEYDRSKLLDGNVVLDFLDKVNISSERFIISDEKDNVHDSWSNEFVEVKKILNQKTRSRVKEDTIIALIDRLSAEVGSKEKYQIESDTYKKAALSFMSSNVLLSENYNKSINVFSETTDPELYVYKEVSKDRIDQAMSSFKKEYCSVRGFSCYAYHFFRRYLKKYSPFLFSCAARIKRQYFS